MSSKKRRRRRSSRRSAHAFRRFFTRRKMLAAGAVVLLAIAAVVGLKMNTGALRNDGSVSVTVPQLSAVATRGAQSFAAKCAGCHGVNAAGSNQGPPLVHKVYEPSHHGDAAFHRAVRLGVQPHHWDFGPMPKVDVTSREIAAILVYVRELQRANGVF